MTEDREHVVDELGAYVLDALDEAERTRVRAHLAVCSACAERLADYRAVTGTLPFALPPVSPPPEAWTTIHAVVRQRRARAWPRLASGGRWIRVARWSAAAAIVAGLLAWNIMLQRQVWRYAEGPQVEKLARRPGRLVILTGARQARASARPFAAVDGHSGHLAASGLTPLPAGRVYQLWFLRKAAPPASAATFTVDADGRAWVTVSVPGPLDDTRAIVVTEEPAPASPAPTGPRLLEAEHRR